MIRRRALLRSGTGAVALLALSALDACASPRPQISQLVGTWRDDDGDVVLRLDANGRGEGRELLTTQGPASGVCRWHINGGGKVVVDFSITPSALVSTQVFDVGDGGRRLSYRNPSDDLTVAIHR